MSCSATGGQSGRFCDELCFCADLCRLSRHNPRQNHNSSQKDLENRQPGGPAHPTLAPPVRGPEFKAGPAAKLSDVADCADYQD